MNATKWIQDALILAIGAFLLWTLTNSLVGVYPQYSYYGWGIMGAYFAGVVLYLRQGMRNE